MLWNSSYFAQSNWFFPLNLIGMEQLCVTICDTCMTEVVTFFLDLEANREKDEKIRACWARLRLGASAVPEAAE